VEKELQLQPRLQCIASLVPQGARLADVGTDHGYLPVWLLQHGRIESAIASDINALPLDHARATAREYGVTERMDFRLCPGLAKIKAEECDAIAIAGMGGETILGILEAAPWTHEDVHTLILQPQTKIDLLRCWLCGHGYRFLSETLVRDKYPVLGLPIIRGAVTFVDSMVKGVKALMFSADYFPDEDVAEPSKFDQWLEKKLGNEKMQKFITALAVFLSLGLTILLFFLLPTFLAGFIDPYIKSAAVHNLVESVIKLVIFFAYMILCSKQKDIYRVFQYHGAEHKTIFCYEAGLPLTVENCRIQPRHHPRCGTSFLFVVVVVSILVSSLVFSFVNWRNMWVRMALHLLLLIPIVGVTYEFNRYVGGHDNKVTRGGGKEKSFDALILYLYVDP